MTYDELFYSIFNQYNGAAIDEDNAPSGEWPIQIQCVDAFKLVLKMLGDPNYARALGGDGYAHQIVYRFYENGYDEYFDLIPVDYDNFPARLGDVLVYGVTDETPSSHVSLFAGGAGGIYHYSFGQNQGTWDHSFNTITLCDYGVIGILRPKESKLNPQPEPAPVPQPTPKPVKNASGFYDVAEDSYYFKAICWAKGAGLISGINEDYFNPEGALSRGDLSMILWRLKGAPQSQSNNPFNDILETDYYYQAILWAAQNGITKGSGYSFRPTAPCTRGEAVTFLYRLCGSIDMGRTMIPYVDVATCSFYYDAVRWAHAHQVIVCGNKFRPDEVCTRAQFITMLQRVVHNGLDK